jgi:hypothetical protein
MVVSSIIIKREKKLFFIEIERSVKNGKKRKNAKKWKEAEEVKEIIKYIINVWWIIKFNRYWKCKCFFNG